MCSIQRAELNIVNVSLGAQSGYWHVKSYCPERAQLPVISKRRGLVTPSVCTISWTYPRQDHSLSGAATQAPLIYSEYTVISSSGSGQFSGITEHRQATRVGSIAGLEPHSGRVCSTLLNYRRYPTYLLSKPRLSASGSDLRRPVNVKTIVNHCNRQHWADAFQIASSWLTIFTHHVTCPSYLSFTGRFSINQRHIFTSDKTIMKNKHFGVLRTPLRCSQKVWWSIDTKYNKQHL